ncbi:choice-of-anchor I family protein [Desulfuromonas thiophila]|uniref:Choice-of-anchor I domain-containing protein n=1 Tax=Desulfuromonas thiophila TaxID=57664 RepID=A0A1G7C6X8_9BACT|nr:choice-of-anchor I family protein [Desulfuromonas thiophila]SDE34426.1 hypothetical protein SAMN05661003_10876 [Desulfuromonas thiophila]
MRRIPGWLALLLCLLLAGCGSDGDNGRDGADGTNGVDGSDGADGAAQVVSLRPVAATASQGFDQSAAEIVTFDAVNRRVLVVNADSGQVDVFNAASLSDLNDADPATRIDLAAMLVSAGKATEAGLVGAANSIALQGELTAIAVEAMPKTNPGWVVFIHPTTLAYINAVQVGALPDMVTFTPDGSRVVVANEGEPDEGYVNDPAGSVSIIRLADYSVTEVDFSDFNAGAPRHAELPVDKMVLDGYNATVAQSLEPEYVSVSADSATAYVTLQENNAIAVIDLAAGTVKKILGLGFKDHSIPGNELDISQKDGVNIRNWPVMGIYMPDAITSYHHNGRTFLVTANEGDSREDWLNGLSRDACEGAGYFYAADDGICVDEFSAKDYYDSDNVMLVNSEGNPLFPTNGGFGGDDALRRLKFSYHTTVAMNGGTEFEKLYAYGARSFSIWEAETGLQVFDSGNDFERITALIYGADFNNDNAANAGDDRSDNKGPEAEAVTLGVINGHTYAFIALERMGGIMVYDVSNPYAPAYVQYINQRDVTVDDVETDLDQVGDLGPEGLHFVSATDSPGGKPLLLVGNEVSGTTAVYEIDLTLLEQ